MAGRDVTKILKTPGRLIINPSNLAAAFPYGGTELGGVRGVGLRLRMPAHDVVAEEYDEPVEEIMGALRIVGMSAILRQYDNDVMATVFPDTSTGAGGDKVVNIPGTARAGRLGSASAVVLLFVADDKVNAPSVILYKAIPSFAGEVDLACSIQRERAIAVLFKPIRDTLAPPRVGKIGLLASLVL